MATTTRKSTGRKTGGTPKTASKPRPKSATSAKAKPPVKAPVKAPSAAPTAATATPAVVNAPEPVVSGPILRKKELINTVVERSGIKKKDAKPVIEAMLAVLGEALGKDREMNLPPFAKLKVQRTKQKQNGRIIVARMRQPRSARPAPATPIKDAAE